MVWYPCCCQPLQVWCKLFAAFEVVSSIFSLGFQVTTLISLQEKTYPASQVAKSIIIVQIVMSVMQLFFGVVLGVGAWKRNTKCCWSWVGFSALQLLVELTLLVILASTKDGLKTSQLMPIPILIAGYVVGFLLQSYIIYVVYAFIVELRDGRQQQPGQGPVVYYVVGVPSQPQGSMQKTMETPTSANGEQPLELFKP